MGRRIARTAAAAALGAGALSACAPSDLGAAAVVDSARITVSEIQGSLAAVRALQNRYGMVNEDPGSAARNEVERRVVDLVFEKAARDLGVIVTRGEVSTAEAAERKLVGGDRGFAQALARGNLSLAVADEVFRQQLLSRKMAQKLGGATGLTPTQINSGVESWLESTAKSMRIRINPRYGRFDANLGRIGPPAFDFLRAAD
jgi:hypothetical protein